MTDADAERLVEELRNTTMDWPACLVKLELEAATLILSQREEIRGLRRAVNLAKNWIENHRDHEGLEELIERIDALATSRASDGEKEG